MSYLLKIRRGDNAYWRPSSGKKPILLDGEMGHNTTTNEYKVGDGVTHFDSLPHAGLPPLPEDHSGDYVLKYDKSSRDLVWDRSHLISSPYLEFIPSHQWLKRILIQMYCPTRLSNYPYLFTVVRGNGSSGNGTIYAPSCNSDFSDIRFVSPESGEICPYWIESISGTIAKVWVLLPDISENSSVYCYWQNPLALSLSNGQKVFLLFDDFGRFNLGTDPWTQYAGGPGEIINGALKGGFRSNQYFGVNTAIRTRVKYEGTSYPAHISSYCDYTNSVGTQWNALICVASNDLTTNQFTGRCAISNSAISNSAVIASAASAYIIYETRRYEDKAEFLINNTVVEVSQFYPTNPLRVGNTLPAGVTSTILTDWFLVRKFDPDECMITHRIYGDVETVIHDKSMSTSGVAIQSPTSRRSIYWSEITDNWYINDGNVSQKILSEHNHVALAPPIENGDFSSGWEGWTHSANVWHNYDVNGYYMGYLNYVTGSGGVQYANITVSSLQGVPNVVTFIGEISAYNYTGTGTYGGQYTVYCHEHSGNVTGTLSRVLDMTSIDKIWFSYRLNPFSSPHSGGNFGTNAHLNIKIGGNEIESYRLAKRINLREAPLNEWCEEWIDVSQFSGVLTLYIEMTSFSSSVCAGQIRLNVNLKNIYSTRNNPHPRYLMLPGTPPEEALIGYDAKTSQWKYVTEADAGEITNGLN